MGNLPTESRQRGRRSIRLKGYDYAQSGEYFVTLHTYGREYPLGRIRNEEVILTEAGKIAEEEWLRTPRLRPNVTLDAFAIMPNHIHGIIVIRDERKGVDVSVGANCSSPVRGIDSFPGKTPFRSPSGTVGAIVRGFKAATTKRVNELHKSPGKPLWQRNYYEHVVRDENDLDRVREYIVKNPMRWSIDEEPQEV